MLVFLAHGKRESGNNEWNIPASSKTRTASQKTSREKHFYICFTAPRFCWRIFHSSRCFLGHRESNAGSDQTTPNHLGEGEGPSENAPSEILLQAGLNTLYSSRLLPCVLYFTLLRLCLCFAGILFLSWVRAGMCVSLWENEHGAAGFISVQIIFWQETCRRLN